MLAMYERQYLQLETKRGKSDAIEAGRWKEDILTRD
jgi:hypothetical protein